MLKFLKPLSFLPAILMMYLIFSFSSQDGITSAQLSYKVSYKIVETGGELLGADFEPWEIDNLATRFHGVIRKIAHMTEYFALAVSVAFPLYVYGLRGILLMLTAGFFCVVFACGDEYHQSMVEGRGPSSRDVFIDSFGVFWGIVLVRIVGWTGRKTIFRPFSKKKKNKHTQESQPYPYQPPYQQQPYQQPLYQQPLHQQQQAPNQKVPYQQMPYQSRRASYQQMPYQNQQAPYQQGAPQQRPYPPQERPSYYPPRENSPYGYPPYSPDTEAPTDRLSEDMSLRKLMHDLKEQKKKTNM